MGHILVQRVGRPVATLELLAGAAWAEVIAAGISRLAQLVQSLLRSAAGKPVGMDIASSGGDPVNKSLMSCNGVLVRVDQFFQPLPAALGAVEVDHLKPVRPRLNERMPTHRIERDALDVAAAPVCTKNSHSNVAVMKSTEESM